MTAVVVVGSANLDVVLTMAVRPRPGETLLGTGYGETAGGKGANQAMAAARLADTAFVGSVGRDSAGTRMVDALRRGNVDTRHLLRGDMPTGRAFVSVTPDGENSILVLPLANGMLSPGQVQSALDALRPQLVLTQLEVAEDVTVAVAAWCTRTGSRMVLNPSPVRTLPDVVLRMADPVIANSDEAAALLGRPHDCPIAELAGELATRARSVVLTAGAEGAIVARGGVLTEIPGVRVLVRDTTGAGDAFAGTLVGHLSAGVAMEEAARLANHEAARVAQLDRSAR